MSDFSRFKVPDTQFHEPSHAGYAKSVLAEYAAAGRISLDNSEDVSVSMGCALCFSNEKHTRRLTKRLKKIIKELKAPASTPGREERLLKEMAKAEKLIGHSG